MFEAHFGLRENPFSTSHDPRFVYPSPEHLEAVAHFRYGVQNREAFVLVTGEVGTGKTTAVRDLTGRLQQHAHVALLSNTALSKAELLEEVCHRFGVTWDPSLSKPGILERLERGLGERLDQGETCILIIDEAQNLSVELLEEIRLLSNLEWRGGHLVHICLAGQPELEDRLASPELRPLRQRISVKYRLKPLDRQETERYLHHRLRVAGGDGPHIFPADAAAAVHGITNGIPREINIVAAQALLNAYVDGAPSVRPEHIRQVVDEFGFQSVLSRTRPEPPAARPEIGPVSAHAANYAPVAPASAPPPAPAPAPTPPMEVPGIAPVAQRPAVAPTPQAAPPAPRPRETRPVPTPHVPPHAPTFARPAPVLESPAGVSSAATARSIHNWRDQPAAVAPGEPMSTWEPEEKGSPFGWIRRIPLWAVLSVILIGAVIALLASGLPGNLWRSWSTGSLRQEEQSSNESVPPAGEEPARATPSRAAAHPGSTNPHAALPPSESSARYGIQAASFKSEENARAALVGLQRATGLTGTVLPSGGSGARWYRVVLGEFEHASAAVNKAQELSQKGVVPGDRVVVVLEPESAPPARR